MPDEPVLEADVVPPPPEDTQPEVPPCARCGQHTPMSCSMCGNNECCDCRCWTCDECDSRYLRTNGNRCDSCSLCEDCCVCHYCDECDSRYATRPCSECDRCENCCEGHAPRHSAMAFFNKPLKFHPGEACPTVPFVRATALEIEASSFKQSSRIVETVKKWGGSIVKDGSIDSEDDEGAGIIRQGFEINVSPASGDAFEKSTRDITTALKSDGASANRSCGLHCHVDAGDFNWFDVRRLIRIYAKVEDALFSIIEPSRKNNTYCTPCASRFLEALKDPKTAKDIRSKTRILLYGNESMARQCETDKYGGGRATQARYTALNIHSWMYRGTIEFRMHHGTVKFEDCLNWGLLCGNIVETVKNGDIHELKKWSDGIQGLLHLAPTSSCKAWVLRKYRLYTDHNYEEA